MALSRLLKPMHTESATMICIAEIDVQSAKTAGKPADNTILDLELGVSSEIISLKLEDDFHKQVCDASGHLYRRFYY